mmetsp:Transcript_9762/g.27945  ORF Transcript_9762/g.27945 Transcript_9762/m.27945 type:complete len:216 (-) Transcript_9762:243-890(-)
MAWACQGLRLTWPPWFNILACQRILIRPGPRGFTGVQEHRDPARRSFPTCSPTSLPTSTGMGWEPIRQAREGTTMVSTPSRAATGMAHSLQGGMEKSASLHRIPIASRLGTLMMVLWTNLISVTCPRGEETAQATVLGPQGTNPPGSRLRLHNNPAHRGIKDIVPVIRLNLKRPQCTSPMGHGASTRTPIGLNMGVMYENLPHSCKGSRCLVASC